MSPEIALVWSKIRERSTRYPPGAYVFVQEGLRSTTMRLLDDEELGLTPMNRHVTGQQLSLGLRDFAIDQFGLMARPVLEYLDIRRTDDFGRIVFTLVEIGLMRKSDDDRLDDFEAVFDFDEAFGVPHTVAD